MNLCEARVRSERVERGQTWTPVASRLVSWAFGDAERDVAMTQVTCASWISSSTFTKRCAASVSIEDSTLGVGEWVETSVYGEDDSECARMTRREYVGHLSTLQIGWLETSRKVPQRKKLAASGVLHPGRALHRGRAGGVLEEGGALGLRADG